MGAVAHYWPKTSRRGQVELRHGLAFYGRREVGVAHRHLDRGVAEQLLNCFERHAAHREMRSERVSKNVQPIMRRPAFLHARHSGHFAWPFFHIAPS